LAYKLHQITVVLVFLVIICCIQGASAGAPPLKDRAGYLLPYLSTPHINQSIGDCIVGTDSFDVSGVNTPGNQLPESVPFFLDLSENNAFMNISCERTGDHYVSEVWYFNNWDEFRVQREHLFHYLNQSSTISNVTLTFEYNETLATYNNSHIEKLKTQRIDAVQYISNSTSGYFIIFDSHFFPGPNYFIAYYGVVGSSDLEKYSPKLKSIMILVPKFMDNGVPNVINPITSMDVPPEIPLPVIILIMALGIVGLIRELQRRH
jgi:hypothetical protein